MLDEAGYEADYEVFKEKLLSAKGSNGKSRPSYAVYDVSFDLEGEGHRWEQRPGSHGGDTLTRIGRRSRSSHTSIWMPVTSE